MKVIFKLMQFIVLFSLISMTLTACGGGGGGEGGVISGVTSGGTSGDTSGDTNNNVSSGSTPLNSTLSFDHVSLTVSTGEDFILNAIIDPGSNNVTGGEIHISYDQTKFGLNSISCASSFSNILYAPPIPTPQDGTARIDCGVPTAGTSIKTISSVATLSFHAIAPVSNSYIIFTTESNASAEGKDAGVIADMTPTVISVTP